MILLLFSNYYKYIAGTSVFLISITSGKLEVVKALLEYLLCGGISKRSLQKFLSPLSLAILHNHDDIFEYLIQQKFDVNAVTPDLGKGLNYF